MRFHITPGDELPIYRQIMRQVIDAIAGAEVQPGSKLPSHRDLAQELVVAPLTVKKAYDELEREGYIRMIRGHGTFVSDQPPMLSDEEKLERLRPMVQRLLHEATLLGVDGRTVGKLLKEEGASLRDVRAESRLKKRRS